MRNNKKTIAEQDAIVLVNICIVSVLYLGGLMFLEGGGSWCTSYDRLGCTYGTSMLEVSCGRGKI